MGNCKPLSITHKQDINNMCKELLFARRALKAENSFCDFNDIRWLRFVLLGCLYSSLFENRNSSEQVNFAEMSMDIDSLLGNGFVEAYMDLNHNEYSNIKYLSTMRHLNAMTSNSLWKQLLPYALEILEYSEQELEGAGRDRRDGIITKKKKQSGVYYTPYDVACYMVNGCLDRLNEQEQILLNCRYIDFSCGSGVFLLQLIECVLERTQPIDYDRYCRFVRQGIFGVDISPYAVECCQYMLLQHTADRYCNYTVDFIILLHSLRKNIVVADATNMDAYYGTHPDFPRRFECIVGNPPYVGVSSIMKQTAKGNLFIPFVYNLKKYSSEKSVCSLVLPLSFSYNNQPGFREMRLNIEADNAQWLIEHYDRSPDSLFGDDVKARACIVFRIGNKHHAIHSTGLMRWTSNSRDRLLTTPKVRANITGISVVEYIPKLSDECGVDAYNKLLRQQKSLSDLLKAQTVFDETCIAIKGTAYNWICAHDHLPPAFNADGSPYVSKDLKIFTAKSEANKYFSLACLNSKLAFWLWTVVGDGFHLTNRLLSTFGFSNKADAYDNLTALGHLFAKEIKKYPTTSVNSGKTITNYDHSQLMDIIRQSDLILAEALNIDQNFVAYLDQWYFNIVSCGRRQPANALQQ